MTGSTIGSPYDPQFSLTITKMADLFQQKHNDYATAEEQKEPSWSHFTTNAKNIILRAMTSDATTAASDPTPAYLEFCTQCTAFQAHQHLLQFFDTRSCSRLAIPSQGMSSALYAGII
jgi:hypothetical protein